MFLAQTSKLLFWSLRTAFGSVKMGILWSHLLKLFNNLPIFSTHQINEVEYKRYHLFLSLFNIRGLHSKQIHLGILFRNLLSWTQLIKAAKILCISRMTSLFDLKIVYIILSFCTCKIYVMKVPLFFFFSFFSSLFVFFIKTS